MSRAKKGAEWTEGSGPSPTNIEELRQANANRNRFGLTSAEELELYRKWCMGYPDNRKHVP